MLESLPGDSVENLGLSPRTRHLLRRYGIRQVSEIAALTDDELLLLHGIGPTTIFEIRAKADAFQNRQSANLPTPLPSADDSGKQSRGVSKSLDWETLFPDFKEVGHGWIASGQPEE